MAGSVGKVKIEIGATIAPLQKALGKAQKSLRKFGRNANFIGQDMTRSLSLPIIGIGTAALSAAADFEKLEKSLTVIMGSGEAAKKELEQLRQVALAPGLGFEQAVAGSVRLQAVGMSADQARQTLAEMGNAIAMTGGSAQDLDAVTMQLTQMISKNRVLQEDFMVLQERMPKVGDAMQAAFGTRNIEDIRDMGISAQDFVAGITSEMAKFDRVQGGLANSFENVRNAIKQSMAEVGKAITDAVDIPAFLENLTSKVSGLVKWFSELSPGVKKAIVIFGALVAAMGPVLMALGSMASGFSAVMSIAGLLISPIGLVVLGVSALAAALVTAYKKNEKFRYALAGLGAVAKEAFSIISEAVKAFISGFQQLREGEFRKAKDSFSEFLVKANPVTLAATQGGRLAKAYRKGYADKMKAEAAAEDADVYFDKDKLLGEFEGFGAQASDSFNKGFQQASGSGGGGVDTESIAKSQSSIVSQLETGMLEAKNFVAQKVPELNAQLANIKLPVKTWTDEASRFLENLSTGIQSFAQDFGVAFQMLNDTIGMYFEARQENLNNYYDNEKARIEASSMSEEGKARAIQRLDEETAKKKRKYARQEAIRQKVLGIFQAIINTASAITQALPNVPLAIAVGAMGAAQVATIAAQSLPALAEGGLAFGPTAALVGDNIGARVDPEVIAPLSKLQDMLGGQQPVVMTTRISGSDILFVQERAKRYRDRTRGY